MRRKLLKNNRKTSAGKLVTGILFGGAVAATVAWLRSSASGEGSRHRLREKIKTSEGNVESQARELAVEVGDQRNPL
jgi:gas vesicle protein